MKLSLYSLKDLKGGFWMQPMPHRHDTEAQRALVALVATTDCGIARYPADYDLYKIAEFDDATGIITPVEPVPLMNCTAAVNMAKAEYKQFMGQPFHALAGSSAA